MSINRIMLLQQASMPAGEPEAPDELQWLVQLLREVMTAVAAEEGDMLKKAGMIARLGGLLLRASGAAEMKRAYKELLHQYAEVEARLAAVEAAAGQGHTSLDPGPVALEQSRSPVTSQLPPVVPRSSIFAAVEPDELPTLVIGASAGHARDRRAV